MERYWNSLTYYYKRKLIEEYSLELLDKQCKVYFCNLKPYERIALYHLWQTTLKFIVPKHFRPSIEFTDRFKGAKKIRKKKK